MMVIVRPGNMLIVVKTQQDDQVVRAMMMGVGNDGNRATGKYVDSC